jgi:hypothetical protein
MIPDRHSLEVRRLIVDPASGENERLPDISMPRKGARIYGSLVDSNRLLAPVSANNELHLLVIDLDDQSHSLHRIDHFTSKGGEPPRMQSIFQLPGKDRYAVVYMRPAEFSDRFGRKGRKTGLLGEIVVNTIEKQGDDYHSVRNTVIAGFKAQAAATHNMAVTQIAPDQFLLAHTEVDRIHERHLSGKYENYVGGFVTQWRIDDEGRPHRLGMAELPPFFSTRLETMPGERTAVLLCNLAQEGDPMMLFRIQFPGQTGQ